MPGPKVPSRSVDKIIGFEKGCVKLIVSAADAGFVTKSVRFFEAFESKLRPWGFAELFGLLLTRRVRVVVDSGGSAGDFSPHYISLPWTRLPSIAPAQMSCLLLRSL